MILITIDSLRADRLTEEFFPQCWPLFEEFERWTQCYSNGVCTPIAFPPLLGEKLNRQGLLLQSVTMPCDSWGYSNNPHLDQHRYYDRHFTTFNERPRWHRWLRRDRSATTMLDLVPAGYDIAWVHLMDLHYPFDGIEDACTAFADQTPTTSETKTVKEHYNAAILELDDALASFLDARSEPVVIMSDHGEAFGEHGYYGHPWTAKPVDELIHVPLLIRSGSTAVHEYPVQNADFAASATELTSSAFPATNHSFWTQADRVIRSMSNGFVRNVTNDTISDCNAAMAKKLDGTTPKQREQLRALGYL